MTENNKKKQLRINIDTPEKFPKIASTAFETTQRLAKRINTLFETAFADYHGSVIYSPTGQGNTTQFVVELHFKPLPAGAVPSNDDRVRAFKPIEENGNTEDVFAGVQRIWGAYRTSAKFQLTQEAAEILSEFMFTGANVDANKPSSYDGCKAEYVDNSIWGANPLMVKITNLDLAKLVRKIYGNKNEEGKRVEYNIISYGPMVAYNNPGIQSTANHKVQILQIESERVRDVAIEFGVVQNGNGAMGPIVTGTI